MEIRLSENIRALRKKRGLTQEQLAEALNVSVGAISKWENALSTPELSIIMALAGFFETSVDVLLGYQRQDALRAQLVEQIRDYIRDRTLAVPWDEIECALLKYPNDFEVVYRCATLYEVRGVIGTERRLLNRALTLMEDAARLIEQNTDESISLARIQYGRAMIELSLDRPEEALAILKANNPCGVHSALIGATLAADCNQPEAALPYLSAAMQASMVTQSHLALGYLNVYMNRHCYTETIQVADWILGIMALYRLPGQSNYLDKEATLYHVCRGYALLCLNRREEARSALREARNLALRFDAAPSYAADRLRFVMQDGSSVHDTYGATALAGLERVIAEQKHAELMSLWEEIQHEEI